MSQNTINSAKNRGFFEGMISAISVGFFFVLVGIIFVINQNLWQNIVNFGKDFTTIQVANTNASLPVPATPAAHTAIYSAAFQFAIGIAILQIVILALRLTLDSYKRRIAQTVGSLVFWVGAAYLISILVDMKSTLAHSQQLVVWYQFWSAIIILLGFSIIVRSIVLFLTRKKNSFKL